MTEHKVHRATVEYVSVVKFPGQNWRKCINVFQRKFFSVSNGMLMCTIGPIFLEIFSQKQTFSKVFVRSYFSAKTCFLWIFMSKRNAVQNCT